MKKILTLAVAVSVGGIGLVVASCASTAPPRAANQPPALIAPPVKAAQAAATAPLKVGLYPYVPRLAQFQQVIASEWQKVQPTVPLEWASGWDGGYSTIPDTSYDVFVFDAINLGYFQANGYLYPLPIDQVTNYADLVPFAKAGVTSNNQVLAIPQLGCGDFLFYRANDRALASVTTASQLATALGSCGYFTTNPPNQSTGLMVDLGGGTTASATYLESQFEQSGQFPVPLPTTIDPAIAGTLQGIVGLASFANILYSSDAAPYQRATWFSQGFGRAYVGFTESMSQLDPQTLASIAFKPMVWSNNPSAIGSPLLYSDAVGVGAGTVGRGTTTLATQLANLMTSPNVIVQIFGPSGAGGTPQYLMPVSSSALAQLAAQFPAYQKMATVLGALSPTLFNFGPSSKTWIAQMKSSMQSMMLASAKCYCDFPSPPIYSNADAQTKCPSACGQHGWNGQWTSAGGRSVCGCDGACASRAGATAAARRP